MLGKELVERRIQRADRDRRALHGQEEPPEVRALQRKELLKGALERADRLPAAPLRLPELALQPRSFRPRGLLPLRGQPLDQKLRLARFLRVQDHRHDVRDALFGEEHVLGAAEADPLGSEVPRQSRVARHVRVGAHP